MVGAVESESDLRKAPPRSIFAQRLMSLFEAAGNPTLRQVATAAEARMKATRGSARGSAASLQRISDWRSGRNVPAQFETLLPILLTLIDLSKKSAASVDRVLVDLPQWRRLWQAAVTWKPETDPATAVCPYRGLTAYQSDDAAWFFGRARATTEFSESTLSTLDAGTGGGIVALVGASGAGKSSLLHAGVIPAVRKVEKDWQIATLTPGARPLAALTEAVGDTWAIGEYGVLIVDQFEELFTACQDEQEREDFLTALAALAGPHEKRWVTVVLAVRADFYAPCLDYPILEDVLNSRGYVLGPMRLSELSEAITGPAAAAGLELEPGLVELVVTELCGLGDHQNRRSYDPGALPLLSHVMAATWEHRERLRLTVAGYRNAGGVTGSVAATAEQAWAELTVTQQIEAKSLLLSLVSVGPDGHDTRRRAARAELITRAVDSEAADAVLETLVRARLVTSDADSAYFTHEIVLRAWPRLRAWIEEDRVGYLVRQRLEADAADWVSAGGDPALLYRGTRLDTAKEAADRHPATETVTEFLIAAQTSRTKSRRWAAATRTVLALLGVGVLVLGIAAYGQVRLKDEQQDNALLSALLTESESLRSTDPTLSAQLTLVAHRLEPDDPEVNSRLLSTQNLPLATPLSGHAGAVDQVAYQPGGALLASAGADRTVRLWDLADRARPQPMGAPLNCDGAATSVTFSPDGKLVAAACGNALQLWNVEDPRHPVPEAPIGGGVTQVAFGPSGRILAAADNNHTVTLWNLRNPSTPTKIGAPLPIPQQIRSMAFHPRGSWLAVVYDDAIQLVTIGAAPTPLGAPIPIPARPVRAVAVSPDGATLAVGSGGDSAWTENRGDATVGLWDIADPARPVLRGSLLAAAKSAVRSLAFGPDGDTLATGNRIGVTVWNIADRAAPTPLGEPLLASSSPCPEVSSMVVCQDAQNSLAFGPDGHTVAAAGALGVVRLWSLAPAVLGGRLGWLPVPPAFSAEGTMVTGAIEGQVALWDVRDRATLRKLADLGPGPSELYAAGASVSRDGRTVASTVGTPPRVLLYDVSDAAHARTVAELPDVFAAMFSPGGRYLWTIAHDTVWSFQVWDLADRAHPVPLGRRMPLSTGSGGAFAMYGARDELMATMTSDRTDSGQDRYVIRLWDLSNPAEPRVVSEIPSESAKPFGWIGITPDGKTLVSLAADTLQVWDITEPARVRKLGEPVATHGLNVLSVDFSADSATMATSSADSTVRLWDFTDRGHPKPLGHSITVASMTMWQLAFDPAGRYLVGTGNGVMSMWDLDPQHAIARICDVGRAVLTREVWQAHVPQMAYRPPC
ncbi:hypothetical protein ACQP1G_16030 [Nocardia sp. CA-107356]|uniref:nSTAND1 domain-containing NTPase n=1 Tax=Nocardia sp. CA-107356 TaxID=3239972 RepID=UPI003D8DA4B8